MNIVERTFGIELPEGTKKWFTLSWFLFAVIGVPSYLLGHLEFGHVFNGTLMLLDCVAVAWALMYGRRAALAH